MLMFVIATSAQKIIGTGGVAFSSHTLNNFDAVTKSSFTTNTVVVTKGFYTANDGGAATYIILDTPSYTVDSIIVVSTANNKYAHLVVENNQIDIRQLGVVSGSMTTLYPSYTEQQKNTVRDANWRYFKKGYAYARTRCFELVVNTPITEVFISDGNGINVANGDKLYFKGTGKDNCQFKVYPAGVGYVENVFEVSSGESVVFDIRDINLVNFGATIETYSGIINYGGDTTKVLLTETPRAAFYSKINAGGVKVDVSRELGQLCKRYTATSYDSTTKVLTLGAIDLSGRQPSNWVWTANDSGYIGVKWDIHDSESDVTQYGEFWNGSSKGFTLISDIHTSLPAGNLDTCKYSFTNVDVSKFVNIISNSWGNLFMNFDNCNLSAVGVAIGRFTGVNNMFDGVLSMKNCKLHQTGSLNYGITTEETSGGFPNVYYGSGTYLHPNVSVEYIDCVFENNIAVATRNFSSTGNASQFLYPEGAKVYAQNSVWRNNLDQYHYLGSSVLPVVFDNCYFDGSNQVQIQRNATFNNCILDGTPVTSYGYDDDDLDGFGFSVKFNGCTLNGHTTSAINPTASVEYNNCQITPSSTTIPFGGGSIKLNNSVLKKNTVNSYGQLFNDGIPYKGIEIINTKFDTTQAVRFFDRIQGSYTGSKLRIVNSEFVNQGIAPSSTASSNPNNFDYNVEIVNSKIAGGLYAGISIANIGVNQGVDIAAKTAATTSFSGIFTSTRWNTSASTLTLNSSNNHFRVNKGAITRIALGSPVNNSLYAGEIYLTAIDTLTFTAYDSISNPNSNVDWTGTVLPKQTVGFYLDPTASLYVGTTTDSLLIGTANGTATLFTKFVDTAIPWFLAGSASITVGATTYTDNGKGRLVDNNGKVVGHLSYFGNTYSINFPVAPIATTQIWLRYQKFNTFHYQGLFRKI